MDFAQLYGQFDLTPEGSIILMAVSLGIFLIFLVIFGIRISQSIKDSALNNGKINQYLAAVPADRIGTVSAIYENTRKHLSGAIILCIIYVIDVISFFLPRIFKLPVETQPSGSTLGNGNQRWPCSFSSGRVFPRSSRCSISLICPGSYPNSTSA